MNYGDLARTPPISRAQSTEVATSALSGDGLVFVCASFLLVAGKLLGFRPALAIFGPRWGTVFLKFLGRAPALVFTGARRVDGGAGPNDCGVDVSLAVRSPYARQSERFHPSP